MLTEIYRWGAFLIFAAYVSSFLLGEIDDFFYEVSLAADEAYYLKIQRRPQEKFILYDVPFTSQAPLGDWKDPRQQNGCEEASALMAIKWARGENLTATEALKEIKAISDFELKNYGEFRDVSANDTAEWIFKGYFEYDQVEVKKVVDARDIKMELYKGNLVVVPVNGQKLDNPFFTPPGPIEHMIVIRGYDPETKEFIANDPGTKNGNNFLYSSETLEKALQDYPTGFHLKILEVKKAMIVVKKLVLR